MLFKCDTICVCAVHFVHAEAARIINTRRAPDTGELFISDNDAYGSLIMSMMGLARRDDAGDFFSG